MEAVPGGLSETEVAGVFRVSRVAANASMNRPSQAGVKALLLAQDFGLPILVWTAGRHLGSTCFR